MWIVLLDFILQKVKTAPDGQSMLNVISGLSLFLFIRCIFILCVYYNVLFQLWSKEWDNDWSWQLYKRCHLHTAETGQIRCHSSSSIHSYFIYDLLHKITDEEVKAAYCKWVHAGFNWMEFMAKLIYMEGFVDFWFNWWLLIVLVVSFCLCRDQLNTVNEIWRKTF